MKKIFASILIALCSLAAFGMPGFTSFLPNNSGTYVYYRDYSFPRESYIGILAYDDVTFQIRYFAPKDDVNLLPEKEVALLLTIDPFVNHWEMTGERIISTILPDDDSLDILNYLHDILYEFSARRIRLGELTPETDGYVWGNDFWENGYKSYQDYPQFGGDVTVSFDCLIPLFNLKSIKGTDGNYVLQCCTVGAVKSNEDNSFENFKGFKEYNLDSDKKPSKKYKKAKSVKHSCENRTITLDKSWTIDPEVSNFCLLGDDSVITMMEIPQFSVNQSQNDLFTLYNYIRSIYGNYINLAKTEIIYDTKNGTYKIVYDSYQPKEDGNDNYIYAYELFTRNEKSGFDFFSISTYKKAYLTNRPYFEKIIKSYK